MKKFIAILVLISVSSLANAQLYQTKAGLITASGIYKGNAVIAESRQLHMNLNYDRAEINMHVSLPLLVTDNDSLNTLLRALAGSELLFHGRFNSAHVHTKAHPKTQQKVNGTITLNRVTRPFSYTAMLEHVPSGNISCVLTGNFTLDLQQFGIPVLPGENKVVIGFRELLLKNSGDQ